MFNATVRNIAWDEDCVRTTTTNLDGTEYSHHYVFCWGFTTRCRYVIHTFRVNSCNSQCLPTTYTIIFISFPEKFWNDSQYLLYVDPRPLYHLARPCPSKFLS